MKLTELSVGIFLIIGASRVISAETDLLYLGMLKIELPGEVEDYKNSTIEWKSAMETRAQTLIFYYWIQTEKFGIPPNESLNLMLGALIYQIRRSGAFERTFVNPSKFKKNGTFAPFSAISVDGTNKIEVNTKQDFDLLNRDFIKFVNRCEANHKSRLGIK